MRQHIKTIVLAAVALVMGMGMLVAFHPTPVQAVCEEVVVPLGEEVPDANASCFLPNSAPCTNNNQCASFLCSGSRCAGDRQCSRTTFTNTDVDRSQSCFDTGSRTFKYECMTGYNWTAGRCVPVNCSSGWVCGDECASAADMTVFNNTWCNGRARWLYESGNGQGISCGGSASEAKSVRSCATLPACRNSVAVRDGIDHSIRCSTPEGATISNCAQGYNAQRPIIGELYCASNNGGTETFPLPLENCDATCPAGSFCACGNTCQRRIIISATSTARTCGGSRLVECRNSVGVPATDPHAEPCSRGGVAGYQCRVGYNAQRDLLGNMACDPNNGSSETFPEPLPDCVTQCQAGRHCVCPASCPITGAITPSSATRNCSAAGTTLQNCRYSSQSDVPSTDSHAVACLRDGQTTYQCQEGWNTQRPLIGNSYCAQNQGSDSTFPIPLGGCSESCPSGRHCNCPAGCAQTAQITPTSTNRRCDQVPAGTYPAPAADGNIYLDGCTAVSQCIRQRMCTTRTETVNGVPKIIVYRALDITCTDTGAIVCNNSSDVACRNVAPGTGCGPNASSTSVCNVESGSTCRCFSTGSCANPVGSARIPNNGFVYGECGTGGCAVGSRMRISCSNGVTTQNCATSAACPTPTPTAVQSCGLGRNCNAGSHDPSTLPGSSQCIAYGSTSTVIVCCPLGEQIVNGTCSGSVPTCGSGLECQGTAIPNTNVCRTPSGQTAFCCPSGQRLVNGVCVLPTPGSACNNTEGRWVANTVDVGGECCGGGTLECKSGRCNANANQLGSCLAPLPAGGGDGGSSAPSASPTSTPTATPSTGGGTPDGSGGGGNGGSQPNPDLPQPTPTPRPACNYTYSEWNECRSGLQTRQILTATPANCVGNPEPVVRTCGDEFKCEVDADCATYAFCYQPPMPTCPAGMSCTQVMPPKECQLKVEVADVNGDKKVNVTDLSRLLKNLLTADAKSDFNKDGIVDLIDYALLVRRIAAKPFIDRTNR